MKHLSRLIEQLLTEEACVSCGDPHAYIGGLGNVECPNEDCEHFSQRQLDDVIASGKRKVDVEPGQQSRGSKPLHLSDDECSRFNDLIIDIINGRGYFQDHEEDIALILDAEFDKVKDVIDAIFDLLQAHDNLKSKPAPLERLSQEYIDMGFRLRRALKNHISESNVDDMSF